MGEFYRTGMGHKFYEGTMPALVTELRKLNDNLEKMMQAPGLLGFVQKVASITEPHDTSALLTDEAKALLSSESKP